MICSTCSIWTPFVAISSQRVFGRDTSWAQCWPCFNAEEARHARDRDDDARRVQVKRGRK